MSKKIKRIYLESRFFGGSGGSEKNILSILTNFPKHIFFDVNITRVNLNNGFKGRSFKFVKKPYGNYDLAIKLGEGKFNYCVKAVKKIIVPCGDNISEFQKDFDIIWIESKDSDKEEYYLPKFICPPIFNKNITSHNFKENYISDKFSKGYYVTVANTYDLHIKGIDLIYKITNKLDKPLIWFTSENKIGPINFLKLGKNIPKNLYIAMDIPHEIILDTIKKSNAYISFSRSESFGWAIAEAISLNVPIISRNVGVVSYFPEDFLIYNDSMEIPELSKEIKNKTLNYSKYHKLFDSSLDILYNSLKKLGVNI